MIELWRELWEHVRTQRKWWLVPMVAVLLLLAVVAVAVEGGAVFLYPFF